MMSAMGDAATAAHRGRPRSAEADQAIAEATMELLSEDGWAGLTMNGVAHRAGVSTATLYRRYSSKEDLVCAAMRARADVTETPDHGSLEADLRARLSKLVEKIRGDGGRMTQGLIGEVVRNPRLADLFRNTLFAAGRDDLRRVLDRAVARGEIDEPEDVGLVDAVVVGPLFYRLLITGEPVTARVVDKLLPLVMTALGART